MLQSLVCLTSPLIKSAYFCDFIFSVQVAEILPDRNWYKSHANDFYWTCTVHILGTVFYLNNAGACDACQIPHNVETPVSVLSLKRELCVLLAADEFR